MNRPTIHTLENGMTAVLVPEKNATSMTIFVMVRVGSRYETREINGASHFIEHLMFKGTKRRPTTEILTRTIDRYGAEYNAFTGKDLTAYYIKVDAAQTELAIDLLHDMLVHSLFDPKEIDRERGVIIEEINMYEDNPRMHLSVLLEEALFPSSSLGWNIAGPRETIRSISRDALLAYRDRYYIPERMTVVVAGKILPGVLSLLRKTFGRAPTRIRGKDDSFTPFCPPLALQKPIALQPKQTEQVQLAFAFHGPSLSSVELPAASLLATILGGSMSSRLFIQIRERLGLCYSISAGHEPLEDTGCFTITAGLDKKRVPEAIKAIIGEMKKMIRTTVTARELREAKDHLRGRTMLAFEDSAAQADWYGRQWTFLKRVETPEERMRVMNRVTASQVRSLAKKMFRFERMATAVIGPFDKPAMIAKLLRKI